VRIKQIGTDAVGVLCACLVAVSASGQPVASGKGAARTDPVAPAVISRDEQGVTLRAVRLSRPLDLDGRLDDEVYQTTQAIENFIQQEPQEGAPATERTEAWVFFDDRGLYISARCWDSHPERDVVTEMRRDSGNILQNESFSVVFDTFHDRRNGFFFQTTPIGALRDQAVVDDVSNIDWNTVWEARTARFEGGWTVEISVPFKSLRYPGAGPQVWGVNLRRIVKWKNEYSYVVAMPASFGVTQAIRHLGEAATLVGVEAPGQSMNLELTPYAVSSSTTDRTIAQPFSNKGHADAGFDFKYGLTRSLIADVTVNTDFAQVEEDVQQVNLTRFSLFFPEKRGFFLEGQGLFAFGGVGTSSSSAGDVPILFFSRRIGLNNGQEVPVIGGGRVTGRSGPYSIGALNIETGEKASANALTTNFTAVRLKRDILRRSNIGMILTRRSKSLVGDGSNSVAGVDANFFLHTNVTASAYLARSQTTGVNDGTNYRGAFEYAGDRYGLSGEHLLVGRDFDAQTGYVRRTDMRRTSGEARFSPRPKNHDVVRKYTYQASLDYLTDAAGNALQNREARGLFTVDFQSSDLLSLDYTRDYELVPKSFTIAPGVVVPPAGYTYQTLRTSYTLGPQRLFSGRVAVGRGTFYDGTRTEASYSGRVAPIPQFAVEPAISLNWVDLPFGEFSAQLLTSRFILTPTPRMMLSSLLQFNASVHTLSSSVRLRWEYRPGSDFFAVYSDGRETLDSTPIGLQNRTLAVKITRLLRF
jgi:hypothetical protein